MRLARKVAGESTPTLIVVPSVEAAQPACLQSKGARSPPPPGTARTTSRGVGEAEGIEDVLWGAVEEFAEG